MSAFSAIIKRDLRLSFSRGSSSMVTLFFFVVVVSLFPFAMGGEPAVLKHASSGIVWIAVVLASLLSLENIYHRDYEDGSFALLLLSPVSPVTVIAAKICAHWLASGFVLLLASVIVAQMLFVPIEVLGVLLGSLFLGTVYMSMLGAIGAVLTFGTKRPGLLLALLILPLYIPMLILGVMAMEASIASLPFRAYLLLQSAMVVAALPISSLVGAVFLRMNLRS